MADESLNMAMFVDPDAPEDEQKAEAEALKEAVMDPPALEEVSPARRGSRHIRWGGSDDDGEAEEDGKDGGKGGAANDEDEDEDDEDDENEDDEASLNVLRRRVEEQPSTNTLSNLTVPPDLLTYRTVGGIKTGGRPTMAQLLYGGAAKQQTPEEEEAHRVALESDIKERAFAESLRRFGMWDGVFARCLLNIFGVILFIRLGLLTGVAGVGWMSAVILLSGVITLLTTLSLSAIITNGEVKSGGAYYLISRALGPSFGGSIGVLFAAANAVAIALYVIGFAETVIDQTGTSLDIRVIGIITLAVVLIMCMVGVDWVVKVQLALLALLVVCILSIFIGMFVLDEDPEKGVFRPSSSRLAENAKPDWSDGNFFFVFGIFFPAATGIMAGANISGEVKSPHHAIPWGTIYAVVVSTVVYIALAVALGATVARETLDGTEGLLHNNLVMTSISFWPPLIYFGIYAATLSSAIASLVGAPRILLAVAQDDLFPALKPFAKLRGKEPWNGYFISTLIAFACVLVGDLNAIAPLITALFLLSYTLVNFACFAQSYARSPGWRPNFPYYNAWVSLGTAVASVVILFLLSVIFAAASLLLCAGLYFYLERKDLDVDWGSAIEASRYKSALVSLRKLERSRQSHVKLYKPQLLVLGDDAPMVLAAQLLRKSRGAIVHGRVLTARFDDLKNEALGEARRDWRETRAGAADFFKAMDFPVKNAFHECSVAPTFCDGARALALHAGFGQIRPNVLMIGFAERWADPKAAPVKPDEYVRVLREAMYLNLGVVVVRKADRLHRRYMSRLRHGGHGAVEDEAGEADDPYGVDVAMPDDAADKAEAAEAGGGDGGAEAGGAGGNADAGSDDDGAGNRGAGEDGEPRDIHVWALLDDGGLTLLLGHLLSLHRMFRASGARLCVASLAIRGEVNRHTVQLAQLLRKFRIDATILPAYYDDDEPGEETVKAWRALWRGTGEPPALDSRTARHLKVAELLREHSGRAAAAVVTLPTPELSVSAPLYMSWIDMLSAAVPGGVYLTRGNNESCLSFEL